MTFEYLRQSLFFFKNNLAMIIRIQLPFLLLFAVAAQFIGSGGLQNPETLQNLALVNLLNLTLMPIYRGAIIAYLGSVVDNKPLSVFQCLSIAMGRWRHLLLVYIFTGFAVASGFMLLIIPGIVLLIRFAFADYACILEGKSSLQAMKSSWKATPAWFWPLLSGLSILFFAAITMQVGLSQLLGLDQPENALLAIPVDILFGLMQSLFTVFGFRIYCVMREEKAPATE